MNPIQQEARDMEMSAARAPESPGEEFGGLRYPPGRRSPTQRRRLPPQDVLPGRGAHDAGHLSFCCRVRRFLRRERRVRRGRALRPRGADVIAGRLCLHHLVGIAAVAGLRQRGHVSTRTQSRLELSIPLPVWSDKAAKN